MVAAHNRGQMGTLAKVDGKEIEFRYERIDEHYLPTLQIPVVKGRNFSRNFPADSTHAILVNEAFVKEAGWKDPIGQTVDLFWRPRKLTVVGVVKDYHYESLKEKIKPQVFTTEPEKGLGQLWIKIKPDNEARTLKVIEKTYKKLVPFYPFKYEFKDEANARQYEAEAKWKQIITFATGLTIFISCIGLFGLTTLSTRQRTKEIGIRKVFGASVNQIVALISKDFLQLVVIASIIAIPIAWYATNQWLQNFAYRIELSWWGFALAGAVTITIALVTVSFQAVKAALANPANSLRNE